MDSPDSSVATARAFWKQQEETRHFRNELDTDRLALLEELAKNAGGASPDMNKQIRLGARATLLGEIISKLSYE
jgi:hypothetical protein